MSLAESNPALAGFYEAQQAPLKEMTGQLGNITSIVQLQNALRQQAQEQAFRKGLADLGANPTQEALAQLAAKFAAPKDVLAREQSSLDRKAAIEQAAQKGQPVGSGGLRMPSGEIIPPAARPDSEKRPLIQMLPISQTHEQPHISHDNGASFTPIPGSSSRPIFNQQNTPTEQDTDAIAKAIAEYRQAPLTGFALRSPGAQIIMRKVNELNPQYDAKNFATAQQTMNSFSKGPQGNSVRSFNVALEHLDTLKDLTSALGNNDIPRVNQLAQRVAQELGRPAPTNFDAAKQIIGEEIIKAVVTGGGGVTERQAAGERLSRANSPQQLLGVIDTYQNLLVGQLKGLKTQYEGGTLGRKDFEDRFLTPRARELYKSKNSPADKGSVFDAADAILNGGR